MRTVKFYHIFVAVKRLMKEAQELAEPTEQYHAQPLEVFLSLHRVQNLFCRNNSNSLVHNSFKK